jgi:hypothetical protein
LLAFFKEEYAYYDALVDPDPHRIGVIDVLAPVMMNAFSFGMGASKLRAIHRGLAATCDPLLPAISPDADLVAEDAPLSELRHLLDAAVSVHGVLIPVATKVLHRKRRSLVPMLDNVVLGYYLEALDERGLQARTQDHRAGEVAMVVTEAFSRDLRDTAEPLWVLRQAVARNGYDVTPVRILEVLLWTQVEPVGYYRDGVPAR